MLSSIETSRKAPSPVLARRRSAETIAKARHLLEGVVQEGTGKNLKNSVYPIAGKTGTAQIAKGNGYGKDKSNVTYQASFVGAPGVVFDVNGLPLSTNSLRAGMFLAYTPGSNLAWIARLGGEQAGSESHNLFGTIGVRWSF